MDDTKKELEDALFKTQRALPKLVGLLRRYRAVYTLLLMRRDNALLDCDKYLQFLRSWLNDFEERINSSICLAFAEKLGIINEFQKEIQMELDTLSKLCVEAEELMKSVDDLTPVQHQQGKLLIKAFSLMLQNSHQEAEVSENLSCLKFVRGLKDDSLPELGEVQTKYIVKCFLQDDLKRESEMNNSRPDRLTDENARLTVENARRVKNDNESDKTTEAKITNNSTAEVRSCNHKKVEHVELNNNNQDIVCRRPRSIQRHVHSEENQSSDGPGKNHGKGSNCSFIRGQLKQAGLLKDAPKPKDLSNNVPERSVAGPTNPREENFNHKEFGTKRSVKCKDIDLIIEVTGFRGQGDTTDGRRDSATDKPKGQSDGKRSDLGEGQRELRINTSLNEIWDSEEDSDERGSTVPLCTEDSTASGRRVKEQSGKTSDQDGKCAEVPPGVCDVQRMPSLRSAVNGSARNDTASAGGDAPPQQLPGSVRISPASDQSKSPAKKNLRRPLAVMPSSLHGAKDTSLDKNNNCTDNHEPKHSTGELREGAVLSIDSLKVENKEKTALTAVCSGRSAVSTVNDKQGGQPKQNNGKRPSEIQKESDKVNPGSTSTGGQTLGPCKNMCTGEQWDNNEKSPAGSRSVVLDNSNIMIKKREDRGTTGPTATEENWDLEANPSVNSQTPSQAGSGPMKTPNERLVGKVDERAKFTTVSENSDGDKKISETIPSSSVTTNVKPDTSNSKETSGTVDMNLKTITVAQSKVQPDAKASSSYSNSGIRPTESVITKHLKSSSNHAVIMPIPATLEFKFGSNGTGNECLKFPIGVVTNSKKEVIVADTGNHAVKMFDKQGNFVREIGKGLTRPSAVVVNKRDQIFVKDDFAVHVFSPEGKHLYKIGERVLHRPFGLAMTPNDLLVTLDTDRRNPQVFVMSQDGKNINSFQYEPLMSQIPNSKCRFLTIFQNMLVVSDLGASCLYVTDSAGDTVGTIGSFGTFPGMFNEPSGIAVDQQGHIVVADSKNDRVQIFSRNGVYLCNVEFSEAITRPSDIHLTEDGYLYITNFLQHQIKVYKLGHL